MLRWVLRRFNNDDNDIDNEEEDNVVVHAKRCKETVRSIFYTTHTFMNNRHAYKKKKTMNNNHINGYSTNCVEHCILCTFSCDFTSGREATSRERTHVSDLIQLFHLECHAHFRHTYIPPPSIFTAETKPANMKCVYTALILPHKQHAKRTAYEIWDVEVGALPFHVPCASHRLRDYNYCAPIGFLYIFPTIPAIDKERTRNARASQKGLRHYHHPVCVSAHDTRITWVSFAYQPSVF